jgi:hypothetical protein
MDPCGVYIMKAYIRPDQTRPEIGELSHRRRIIVFGRFNHNENVIVKTIGNRLSRLA